MADKKDRIVVLVHGWSVRSTDTYGELPARLEKEARREASLRLDIRNIWLGKYVSFSDAVRLEDLSRAFEAAVQRELGALARSGQRFICITHSTGGPVVRDWWHRYYQSRPDAGVCPMSHLIMLAPANFGSALAQLGKSRLGRIKAWFEGVEPGEGILDWLELGSPDAWELNSKWIQLPATYGNDGTVYPFVLTGQSIDRKLYDHINTYTGELGSDGVVRAAAANLNAHYVRLDQDMVGAGQKLDSDSFLRLRLSKRASAQRIAFALIKGRSHSGEEMGILRSIRDNDRPHPTVRAILACLLISNVDEYQALCDRFDADNRKVRNDERVETEIRQLLPDRVFIHDAYGMVIFRIQDDTSREVANFDLKLTAIKGTKVSPNFLPAGFIADRQCNRRHPGTITFYFNHDLLVGSEDLSDKDGEIVRERREGAEGLGIQIFPRPSEGWAHYWQGELQAKLESLKDHLKPNQTTLVDIVLRRLVREGTFRLTKDRKPKDFTSDPLGNPIITS
ncbi:MAG: phospholipase [Nitrospira sp.]|nr:MAG: phospholipase [Nitrospira sp.]